MSDIPAPTATYRVQFSLNVRFLDACELVPYLHELGISDLYASPRFKARKGSSHGYDVADPQRINSELGTEDEFEELVHKLKNYGMGMLLDIVPNHMAASAENPWWMDVLENGPSSAYARYFDIQWDSATTSAAMAQEHRILLPVLGDLYGVALENQEITLRLDENGFHLRYYDARFPLDPKTYRPILEHCLEGLRAASAGAAALIEETSALLDAIDRLPLRTTADPERTEERRAEAQQIRGRLWRLYQARADMRAQFEETLRVFNGTRGAPDSFDRLDHLLAGQAYRLAHWKMAAEEINYRRFFDVSDLVGLRVEDPEVFDARHASILRLVKEESISGIRIDHIDGLYDPLAYLRRLQSYLAPAAQRGSTPLYVVVEKILGENEALPPDWPVAGTTGYDFLNAVNGVFIDPQGLDQLEAIYARFTGSAEPFAELCYARNKQVMERLFAGEVHTLSQHLARLAAVDRLVRDLPLSEWEQILKEVTACLPVYRTYLHGLDVAPRDRAYLERTLKAARRRTSKDRVSDAAFAFLRRVFLLEPPPHYAANQKEEWLRFVMRWQQFSGPVMAKGLEDTASYVHNSLISLNEVGGDPLRKNPPLDVQAFHLFNQERLARWPATLNASSTHDTKRSEDVRARINVLSAVPELWGKCLARWSRWNQSACHKLTGHIAPSPSEEALIYQTLLGVWPLDPDELPGMSERLRSFLIKAAREAKTYTNWITPDPEHEEALVSFLDSVLDTSEKNRFLADFIRIQKQIAFYGAFESLSQVLLKITSPGIPDFYQGNELWRFCLVDPDNRRPADFQRAARLLETLKAEDARDTGALVGDLLEHWPDGRVKLFLTWKALNYRQANRELFLEGEYLPLSAAGHFSENLCAFARRRADQFVLIAVPRLLARLTESGALPLGAEVWGAGELALPRNFPAKWQNVMTGETLEISSRKRKKSLRLSEVFRRFPVALLAQARD